MVVETSGTQTATIGTEHSLATPAASKIRALLVDTVNLIAGDVVELRFKAAVLSAGAQSLVRKTRLSAARRSHR